MINEVNIAQISELAIVIAVGVVGLTQLLKNFFACKKGWIFSVISVALTLILCFLHSSLVPNVVTVIADLFAISLAITQLAWDIVAKGVPNMVAALLDRLVVPSASNRSISSKKGKKVEE